MDQTELEISRHSFKLTQINALILQAPQDESLKNLKASLETLIAQLRKQTQLPQNQPAQKHTLMADTCKPRESPETNTVYDVGETVECRYSDFMFYEAVIITVLENTLYEVAFTGYNEIQVVSSALLRYPAPYVAVLEPARKSRSRRLLSATSTTNHPITTTGKPNTVVRILARMAHIRILTATPKNSPTSKRVSARRIRHIWSNRKRGSLFKGKPHPYSRESLQTTRVSRHTDLMFH